MARISFTSSVEEIIGKYGGNVFQDGYFGIQLRGLSKPRNPQTQLQQLRRGDFRFLSSSWRALTPADQATWLSAAGTAPEALRLFIGSNVNLIIAGQPSITSYSPQTTPGQFDIAIANLSPVQFDIVASGAITTVPADTTLLIYSTDARYQSQAYINPAMYYPLIAFPSGENMNTAHTLLLKWYQQFGIMHLYRRICLKSVLINNISGQRGPEFIICSTVALPVGSFIIDDAGNYVTQSGGGYIIAQL